MVSILCRPSQQANCVISNNYEARMKNTTACARRTALERDEWYWVLVSTMSRVHSAYYVCSRLREHSQRSLLNLLQLAESDDM
jgi:hypothetical protein